MKITKVVIKYKTVDPVFAERGEFYVGMFRPDTALEATSFIDVQHAKNHIQYMDRPAEVKILTITVEEQDV